eukprot:9697-Heterococcus_DN1.PRE.3
MHAARVSSVRFKSPVQRCSFQALLAVTTVYRPAVHHNEQGCSQHCAPQAHSMRHFVLCLNLVRHHELSGWILMIRYSVLCSSSISTQMKDSAC